MKQVNIPFEAYPLYIAKFKEEPEECIVNLIPPKKGIIVAPSITSSFNKEAVEQIPDCKGIYPHHQGGTMLVFRDNITLFQFTRNPGSDMKPHLVSFLRSKELSAEANNNDVLVDGFKVCGDMARYLPEIGMYFYGTTISINVDVDMINKVCTKKMVKVPKGLSDYGITRADVLNALCINE